MAARSLLLLVPLFISTPVLAAPVGSGVATFAEQPVSDFALSEIRGTARPFDSSGRTKLRALGDQQSHADELFVGAIVRTQMDVWWGSIGSQLIANAVRDRP